MPENQNNAAEAVEMDNQAEEKRKGARDRRSTKTDRRNSERLAEDIAPRRHPDIKGRRDYDR